jgi:hypothetical protein
MAAGFSHSDVSHTRVIVASAFDNGVFLRRSFVNYIAISEFEHAIAETHGARARLARRERVVERFWGETVWEGEVLVFELLDHPSAAWCYAWEVDGEVTAVLGEPPIKSAQDAVRAAIAAG